MKKCGLSLHPSCTCRTITVALVLSISVQSKRVVSSAKDDLSSPTGDDCTQRILSLGSMVHENIMQFTRECAITFDNFGEGSCSPHETPGDCSWVCKKQGREAWCVHTNFNSSTCKLSDCDPLMTSEQIDAKIRAADDLLKIAQQALMNLASARAGENNTNKGMAAHEAVDAMMRANHDKGAALAMRADVALTVENGGALTEAGLQQMCENKACLASKSYTEPTGLSELWSECSDKAHLDQLSMITPAYNIASALYKAWAACPRTQSDADASEATPMECPSLDMVSHNCGYDGEMISPEECNRRGCCWDPKPQDDGRIRHGRNWCYNKKSQVKCEKKCPTEQGWQPQQREDCQPFLILESFINPDAAVRGSACEQVGCCWGPLHHGSTEPWCFYQPCLAE